MTTDTTYNGWKNYQTWNVALWLGNDYPIYRVASGYSKYPSPYRSFRQEIKDSTGYTRTKDGVSLWSARLDINALDERIREMIS